MSVRIHTDLILNLAERFESLLSSSSSPRNSKKLRKEKQQDGGRTTKSSEYQANQLIIECK